MLIGGIFTNLWLVSHSLLLWLWELLWCDALDLAMPIWPHNHTLECDLFLDAAAGFRHRERAWELAEKLRNVSSQPVGRKAALPLRHHDT